MKILIGDNKQEEREKLARALNKYELTLAKTPEEVVERARQTRYDAVVTDLEYSENGREGYEVLRQIQDLTDNRILYTGTKGFEIVTEGIFSGATEVVEGKNQSELLRIITELHSKRENIELKGGERE